MAVAELGIIAVILYHSSEPSSQSPAPMWATKIGPEKDGYPSQANRAFLGDFPCWSYQEKDTLITGSYYKMSSELPMSLWRGLTAVVENDCNYS